MLGVPHPPSAPQSSPRRRTLSTEHGREIVPPQFPFFNSEQIPGRSRRTPPRVSAPITIDVQLADRGQKIRPLPRIPIPPTPKSAPPLPHRQLSRAPSMRPLPCLPESGALAISVTPATPLPPPTPTIESNAHLAPPRPRPGPPRFTSLSLKIQTSPDALSPRDFGSSVPSPITPTIPEPPSPRTAQRKRISKLRRHLGESVQMQLLLDRQEKLDVLSEFSRLDGKEDDITVGKVLDLEGTDSDSSSEGDGDDQEAYSWGMAHESNRVSQKWIRERGKQRWTEDNFSKVLRDLRAL
ncbi:hypothetical protein B0H17DRAFT_1073402 [Mycena rosella]|uniref:Uncharacterized protein n=1 Tax=Mycena rosella TaxID=1033263 RepID=A0AAD7GAX7_MYCRO|nr:hypothetical protein B0H17DRAFT_1073402 [Mycena rosella]